MGAVSGSDAAVQRLATGYRDFVTLVRERGLISLTNPRCGAFYGVVALNPQSLEKAISALGNN